MPTTFDPAKKAPQNWITLTNGNLTATSTVAGIGGSYNSVGATASKSSGKVTFSFNLTACPTVNVDIGLASPSYSFTQNFGSLFHGAASTISWDIGSAGVYVGTTFVNLLTINGGGWSPVHGVGHEYQPIIDLDAKKLYLAIDGANAYGTNAAAGTGGIDISAFAGLAMTPGFACGDKHAGTINFTPAFIPAGFSAWDAASSVNANAAGAPGTVTTTAPAGVATGSANAAGSPGTITATAPAGVAHASANASGAPGTVATAAPAGTASGLAQASGAIGTVAAAAPGGIAHGNASASGAPGTVTLSAPTGAASSSGSVTASGSPGTVATTAPSGTASGTARAAGSIGTVTATAPTGTATGAGNVLASGAPGTVATAAPQGQAHGDAHAAGASNVVQLFPPEGTAAIIVEGIPVPANRTTHAPARAADSEAPAMLRTTYAPKRAA